MNSIHNYLSICLKGPALVAVPLKQLWLMILLLSICIHVHGQLIKTGNETQANSTTANSQQQPDIAMAENGDYVVVWESLLTDGSGYGIYAQRYTNGGAKNGSEFKVNSTTANHQRYPAVAMDDAGNHVVVWVDYEQDGSGWGIYAQLYDDTNSPVGGEFKVNTTTAGHQKFPSVAMDGAGNFVIVWQHVSLDGSSFDILGQRFASNGSTVDSEFTPRFSSTTFQGYPVVGMDENGAFVIVWQRDAGAQDALIMIQRFDDSGARIGGNFPIIGGSPPNAQKNPSIGMDAAGNYVISWTSVGRDGDDEGIYAALLPPNTSNPISNEFLVNTTTDGHQMESDVSMNRDGGFCITWSSYAQDGSFGAVSAQAFNLDGTKSGGEILVNTRTNDFQQLPAIAQYLPANEPVIVWQDGLRNSTNTHDGDDYGVYFQRFEARDLFVCPTITAISDIGDLCVGNSPNSLEVTGLSDIDSFDISFVLFNTVTTDPYSGGTLLGTVENANISGTTATLNTISNFPANSGNYFIYAILGNPPVSPNDECKPSAFIETTINAIDDASFTYPSEVCLNAGNPVATITGLVDGIFSVDNGASINASTGELDLSSTSAGVTYTITYQTNGDCPTSSTQMVLIKTIDDASFTYPTEVCINAVNPVATVTGLTGGSFSVDNGADINASTGELDLSSTSAGISYTITYTTDGDCPTSSTQMVLIQAADDASFSFPMTACLNGNNPVATITGLVGGNFSIDNGANINASTGELDLSSTSMGTTYTITYSTNGDCPSSSTQMIMIQGTDDASFTYPSEVCLNAGNPVATITGLVDGIFSVDNGASINASTGELDLGSTSAGVTYTITYQTNGDCPTSSTQTVLIKSIDDASFTYPTEVCINAVNPMATVTGLTGGSFSVDNGADINTSTGELDLSSTSAGISYTITYTTDGDCPTSSTQTIIIDEAADAGNDNSIVACENTDIDLSSLISVIGGEFEDPNNTGGLSGNTFTTTGIEQGSYPIWYIMSSSNSCSNDTAIIIVEIQDALTGISLGDRLCENSTYSQELVISYQNASGQLTVNANGQDYFFALTGSPQTVNLTGLPQNGSPVDVTAYFTTSPACSLAIEGLFQAPNMLAINAGNDEDICLGENVNLSAIPTGGSTPFTYEWQPGGQNNASISVSPTQATIYSVTVTDNIGCTATDMVRVNVTGISAINTVSQTSCDPWTNTYAQTLEIVHTGAPGSGMLNVNGQLFSIQNSPQTVVLEGLLADGQTVNISAFFTEESICVFSQNSSFTAPADCSLPCDILGVTTGEPYNCEPISDTYSRDMIVDYQGTNLTGSILVSLDGASPITYPITNQSPQTITLTGLSSDNKFVDVEISFSDESDCSWQQNKLFKNPKNCTGGGGDCDISGLTVSDQRCDIQDNSYEQDLIITYTDAPSTGSILVKLNNDPWVTFPITSSPQTLTLTGLTPDGESVNVFVKFSDDNECTIWEENLFTAPEDCLPPPACEISGLGIGTQRCDPQTNTYEQDIIVMYNNEPNTGELQVQLNGGSWINYPISSSPQLITLSNLSVNGELVDVAVRFSADETCILSEENLFAAPSVCEEPPMPVGTILFVIGNAKNPKANDQLVADSLTSVGYTVILKDDNSVHHSDTAGIDLILVSSSVSASKIGTTYTDVEKPIISYENFLYDDLGMTASGNGSNYGIDNGENSIDILAPSHPMAAGLSGEAIVFDQLESVSWGKPNQNAIVVASAQNAPNLAAIFGYDTAAVMVNGIEPARRVGIFLREPTIDALNQDGWNILYATVCWALGVCNELPEERFAAPNPQVIAYPNPFLNYLNLECNGKEEYVQLSLRNLLGQEVLQEKLLLKGKHQLQLSDIPEGVYILQIIGEKFKQDIKVMRE